LGCFEAALEHVAAASECVEAALERIAVA